MGYNLDRFGQTTEGESTFLLQFMKDQHDLYNELESEYKKDCEEFLRNN